MRRVMVAVVVVAAMVGEALAVDVDLKGSVIRRIEMEPGMELQGKDPEGNFRLLRVVKVEDNMVTVNMNHPLAGMTLVFTVNVVDVRAATETEIAHGHVHTDGDHHH